MVSLILEAEFVSFAMITVLLVQQLLLSVIVVVSSMEFVTIYILIKSVIQFVLMATSAAAHLHMSAQFAATPATDVLQPQQTVSNVPIQPIF